MGSTPLSSESPCRRRPEVPRLSCARPITPKPRLINDRAAGRTPTAGWLVWVGVHREAAHPTWTGGPADRRIGPDARLRRMLRPTRPDPARAALQPARQSGAPAAHRGVRGQAAAGQLWSLPSRMFATRRPPVGSGQVISSARLPDVRADVLAFCGCSSLTLRARENLEVRKFEGRSRRRQPRTGARGSSPHPSHASSRHRHVWAQVRSLEPAVRVPARCARRRC